jgi:hypothetical protein
MENTPSKTNLFAITIANTRTKNREPITVMSKTRPTKQRSASHCALQRLAAGVKKEKFSLY